MPLPASARPIVGDAKCIEVKPITAQDARRLVRQWHYSGKVVNNSQVHLGAFLDGRCGGVMQFGPSLDKRKLVGLVKGTLWNEFIELNRMAFADWMPRNGESRCLAVAFRLLRKQYPHLKWVVSFADATQCGDGTIYRASGFVLTQIQPNRGLYELSGGEVFRQLGATAQGHKGSEPLRKRIAARMQLTAHMTEHMGGGASTRAIEHSGECKLLPGFQLRYVYFLHPEERANLTVPVLPFSAIDDAGARMYKGQKRPPDRGDLANEARRCEPDPDAPDSSPQDVT